MSIYLQKISFIFKKFYYFGSNRYCPVCNKYFRKFGNFGIKRRNDALCFNCRSLERTRLIYLYLKDKIDIFSSNSKNMLHIAPEKSLENKFKSHFGDLYLSADLDSSKAMTKMDIQDIKYKDGTFDIIFCSHVLEHVPNDIVAMKEFYRVLKDDGYAIIQVPIKSKNTTYEDPSITDPEERLLHFGQEDHVRIYGPDFIDRLISVGFKVEIVEATDFLVDEEIEKMGIRNSGSIFYCTKK